MSNSEKNANRNTRSNFFANNAKRSSIKRVTRKLHVLVVQQQQDKKVCCEYKVVCFG